MSNQIVITSGAKLRDLDDVIIGTDGILSSVAFNVANGVPRLDENGKILVSQLPNSVMEFKGVWNAATNTPTLANGTGSAGDVWLCNVAGTVNFGAGPIAFAVGDYAVYTGTVWARSSGATGTVTSVGVSRDGNALTITGSPVTTSGTINLGFSGDNTQYINGAGNLTTFPTLITSIGLTMPAAFGVSNSPLTANGTIGVTALGYPSQYIRGDGTLADFPTSGGGGSSVSYYLNGGTSQGSIGGTTYYEMSKTADTGTGVDFNKTGDGFITAFLTDAGDPALLQIPAGNWNYEIYASMSSNGGTPEMYAELYVYNGSTFTLISTSSHEILYDGVNLNLYTFAMAVPETVLTVTDRLAIKLYATNSGGKTTTIHTQDSHLCQVITTFSTGLTALNGLTAQVQYFGTGTSGSDFNIVSSVDTHTFNLPNASATKRGALSAADWYTFNNKQDYITAGTTLQYWRGDKTWQTLNTSVVPELTNLYFTNARARTAISLTTTGSTGASTYDNSTGVLNIPNYVDQYVGTVTSVGLSAPTGFSVSGSPVTSSGTLALSFASGYSLPTNVKQSNWDDAYTWVAAFPTQTGNTGKFLTTDGSSLSWAANPLGTVTSVAMTVPTGLSIAGSPITSSGTLAVTFAAGYSIPTNASQTTWDTAYTNRITSLTTTGTSGAATLISNVLNIPQYQASLTNPVTGTGTLNYHAKFSATGSTITDSIIYDNGTTATIYGLLNVGGGSVTSASININASNSTAAYLYFNGAGVTNNHTYISGLEGASSNLRFYTSNIEALSINSSQISTFSGRVDITISSGANMILSKPTGPAISFSKTNATAQTWSISTDPNFRISDDTASITPLQITLGTGAAIFYSSITATSFIKVGGTSSQFLKADGSVDSNTYGTFTLPSLTSGSVLFSNGSTIAQNNSQFFWDNTNNRLGVGTSAPSVKLQVNGSGDNIYFNVTNNNGYSIADISAVGTSVSGHGVLNLGKGGTTNVVINGFGDSYFTGGNLGVGINSPTYRLHVSGTLGVTSTTTITNGRLNLLGNTSDTKATMILGDATYPTAQIVAPNTGGTILIAGQTGTGMTIGTTGAATFISSITSTQGFFTNTSGETLTLSKGSGPSIKFSKTSATAQDWSISTDPNFNIYNYTLSNTPFSINATTNATTILGNIYMQSSGNPTQLLAKGTNTEFWVDSTYGGGTARAFVNRGATGNQATLMFTTGVAITNGTAWSGGGLDFSMGTTNDSSGNFYIGSGDIFSASNRAITINSSKNVGIGTSSPATDALLTVLGNISLGNRNVLNTSRYIGLDGSYGANAAQIGFQVDGAYNSYITFNTVLSGISAGQRMTLTKEGNLCIYKTSYDNTTFGVTLVGDSTGGVGLGSFVSDGGACNLWNRKTSTGDIVIIRYNNSGVGSISTNGSTTSYNITSDYRLKQDFKEFNGLSIIDKIKIYDFEWKIDKSRMFGAIAHELQEVLPIAVSGVKDAIDKDGEISAQGVDYSKVVPILVKAIQELKLEIQELKNK